MSTAAGTAAPPAPVAPIVFGKPREGDIPKDIPNECNPTEFISQKLTKVVNGERVFNEWNQVFQVPVDVFEKIEAESKDKTSRKYYDPSKYPENTAAQAKHLEDPMSAYNIVKHTNLVARIRYSGATIVNNQFGNFPPVPVVEVIGLAKGKVVRDEATNQRITESDASNMMLIFPRSVEGTKKKDTTGIKMLMTLRGAELSSTGNYVTAEQAIARGARAPTAPPYIRSVEKAKYVIKGTQAPFCTTHESPDIDPFQEVQKHFFRLVAHITAAMALMYPVTLSGDKGPQDGTVDWVRRSFLWPARLLAVKEKAAIKDKYYASITAVGQCDPTDTARVAELEHARDELEKGMMATEETLANNIARREIYKFVTDGRLDAASGDVTKCPIQPSTALKELTYKKWEDLANAVGLGTDNIDSYALYDFSRTVRSKIKNNDDLSRPVYVKGRGFPWFPVPDPYGVWKAERVKARRNQAAMAENAKKHVPGEQKAQDEHNQQVAYKPWIFKLVGADGRVSRPEFYQPLNAAGKPMIPNGTLAELVFTIGAIGFYNPWMYFKKSPLMLRFMEFPNREGYTSLTASKPMLTTEYVSSTTNSFFAAEAQAKVAAEEDLSIRRANALGLPNVTDDPYSGSASMGYGAFESASSGLSGGAGMGAGAGSSVDAGQAMLKRMSQTANVRNPARVVDSDGDTADEDEGEDEDDDEDVDMSSKSLPTNAMATPDTVSKAVNHEVDEAIDSTIATGSMGFGANDSDDDSIQGPLDTIDEQSVSVPKKKGKGKKTSTTTPLVLHKVKDKKTKKRPRATSMADGYASDSSVASHTRSKKAKTAPKSTTKTKKKIKTKIKTKKKKM